ncbi:hypothetical protein D3C81_1745660 [compost metagenome]
MALHDISTVEPDIPGQPEVPPAVEHRAFGLQPFRPLCQLRAHQPGDLPGGVIQNPGIGQVPQGYTVPRLLQLFIQAGSLDVVEIFTPLGDA